MVIQTKNLLKLAIKHDGNKTKIAKQAGITRQAVSDRFKKNPHIKQAILNVREEALKKAGITRSLVYGEIKNGLKSNVVTIVDGIPVQSGVVDRKERREHAKICLQLFKDLDPDKEQSVQNIGAIIFQMLTNPKREMIEVV